MGMKLPLDLKTCGGILSTDEVQADNISEALSPQDKNRIAGLMREPA